MQLAFDDQVDAAGVFADPLLSEVTFVVVDLETTGSSPADDAITEIGAVKVRGGQVLGEFATLVDPQRGLPPQIVHLTGITTAMVTGAPTIESVLPAFLEFAHGAVLVAHNSRFDLGFLKASALRCAIAWPAPQSLCTVVLARRTLTRDEAPSVRLSELARLFRTTTVPTHRALDDARATVDVLHGLLERIGNQGVRTMLDLREYLPSVTPAQRAKRHLAEHIPAVPGVYLFRGPSGEVLYVGTASNLRRRVRSYFTGAETRTRIKEMVGVATKVDYVECAHALEAGARELRLIAAHTPPYNRRSKYPKRGWWVTLDAGPFPRLKVVRTAPAAVPTLGPIRDRATAADIADLIAEAAGLRTCTTRISRGGQHTCPTDHQGAPEVGGCRGAARPPEGAQQYAARALRAAALLGAHDDALIESLHARLGVLADRQRYESAARLRDRLADLTNALARTHALQSFTRIEELVVAQRTAAGGWDLAVIRHGRLASAGVAPRGVPPMPVVARLIDAAESVATVDEFPGLFAADALYGASPEEARLLRRWVLSTGSRIVSTTDGWSEPASGAGRWVDFQQRATDARSHRALPAARLPARIPRVPGTVIEKTAHPTAKVS